MNKETRKTWTEMLMELSETDLEVLMDMVGRELAWAREERELKESAKHE
jgi:hypothetical protein